MAAILAVTLTLTCIIGVSHYCAGPFAAVDHSVRSLMHSGRLRGRLYGFRFTRRFYLSKLQIAFGDTGGATSYPLFPCGGRGAAFYARGREAGHQSTTGQPTNPGFGR